MNQEASRPNCVSSWSGLHNCGGGDLNFTNSRGVSYSLTGIGEITCEHVVLNADGSDNLAPPEGSAAATGMALGFLLKASTSFQGK